MAARARNSDKQQKVKQVSQRSEDTIEAPNHSGGKGGQSACRGIELALGAFVVLWIAGCAAVPPRDTVEVRRRLLAERVRTEAGVAIAQEGQRAADSPGGSAAGEAIFSSAVKHLNLHAVLAYALEHSPRIQASKYRFLAAEARERAAGYLPDPRFSWSHAFQELQTRNGPVRDVFSLSQTFPYWGKLSAERDSAGAESSAQREAFLSMELGVVRDVQRSYFAIYLTTREIEINDRTRGILERFVRVAQRKLAAGKAGQPDILLAEIELSRLENERIDLDQRLQTERALLNTLLNRKPSAHLPPLSAPKPEYSGELDGLISWMLENLPDVRRYRHIVEENQSRVRLSRLRYIPDVTLGVSYTNVGRSPIDAGAVDSGNDGVAGTLSFNVPLWISKYSAETGAARHALEASRAALADVELLSVYKVLEMHVRVETALRQVTLLRDEILPKATQTLAVLEAAYVGGSVGFLKLLDAERALERFELEYERAQAAFEKRFADLERAVGKPLGQETRK